VTRIDLREYAPDYKEHLEDSSLRDNTVQPRKYAVNELIKYCEEKDMVLDTDQYYESVDKITNFFKHPDVNIHNTKVSGIRDFIDFIGGEVDARTEDQLGDIKSKISFAKLSNKKRNEGVAGISREDIKKALLTDEQLAKVKQEASFKQELLIDFMLDTGARPGEVVDMRPEDIDFDKGSFDINGTYVTSTRTHQDSPKHDSFRTVKIGDSVCKRLKKFIEENEIASSEYVFPNYRTHVYRPIKKVFNSAGVKMIYPCSKGSCSERYSIYQNKCDKCGSSVSRDMVTIVTPHFLRHNTCTRLANNPDNPIKKVRDYMGHKDLKITQKYLHFDSESVVDIEI